MCVHAQAAVCAHVCVRLCVCAAVCVCVCVCVSNECIHNAAHAVVSAEHAVD